MDIIPLFRGSSGLNTKVDPVRIKYNSETGISDLASAVNVTHDDTGRVSRRSGSTLVLPGSFHSLFCDGGDCFICKGQDLYKVSSALTLSGVRGNLTLARVAYCQVGQDTYYCNTFENGVIKEGLSYPWPVHSYSGPETTRKFFPAPIGKHLAFYNGRMYISVGPFIYYSEPFATGLYDLARCYIGFNSDVRMIKPVETGIFVSDSKDTWFFKGDEPEKFEQIKKAPYPALEWSDAIEYIEGFDIGLQIPGLCALWGSTKGAVLGTSEGLIINLTQEKVNYPEIGNQGSGLLRSNHFIHSLFF